MDEYPAEVSADELTRLSLQDKLLNDRSPLFPVGVPIPQRVLDVACGTGGWIRSVAEAYPQSRCIGLDKDGLLLSRARDMAIHLSNATYKQGNMFDLGKIFKRERFDFVQMRCASWFLGSRVQEMFALCHQQIAPGGTFCVIDFKQPFETSSESVKQFSQWFLVALQQRGSVYASVEEFPQYLETLGFTGVQQSWSAVDLSTGVDGREGFVFDLRNVYKVFRAMIVGANIVDEEKYDETTQQCAIDIDAPGFHLAAPVLCVTGTK